MARLAVVHWSPEETAAHLSQLLRLGHGVTAVSPSGPEGLEALLDSPPDAFLVDLDRRPSHGRELAGWLRRRRGTRHVPLLLLGGEPAAVAKTRALLPDATYASWSEVGPAVERALAARVETPSVPGAMAGYSGTPLPKKLGIRAGDRVVLAGAPRGFAAALGELPEGARTYSRFVAGAGVVLLFVRSRSQLDARLPRAEAALAAGGKLWIVWPKKASGVASDLSETVVRATGLSGGLVDYKVAAVDATWSGLCFARRTKPPRR